MTDIQQWQPAEVAIQNVTNPAVHNLHQWAEQANSVYNLASILCKSSFVPATFKGKPEECAAAIMAGAEVGLSPVTSLRAFDSIQGTAAARAVTLRAIVQSHGHEVVLVESNATRCVMKGRRKGTESWQAVTWTIDMAREMGLLSKDNWKKQPANMLVARASSAVCRLIAADAIMGIGYSREELEDGDVNSDPQTVQAGPPAEQPSGTRRMSRKKPESRPEPAPEPEAHEDTGEVPGITQAQSRMLHASFNDAGIKDRDQRLAYCANLIGRDLSSSSDLTKAEATKVIDALVQDAAEPVEAELMEGDE